MVFPVVLYGCESWTIKKVEHRRTEAFELWCCRRLLSVFGVPYQRWSQAFDQHSLGEVGFLTMKQATQPSCLLSSPSPLPVIFPTKASFSVSWLFTSGGQSIGASASVLPMNTQDWFPLGLTGLISLKSKGLSRVFSNTTVLKHQLFTDHPFLWSNSHIHTRLLEKP